MVFTNLDEKSKEARNLPCDRKIIALANNIILDTDAKKEDMAFMGNKKEVKMKHITQKDLYEEALLKMQ